MHEATQLPALISAACEFLRAQTDVTGLAKLRVGSQMLSAADIADALTRHFASVAGEPDHIYDPDDWCETYNYEDRDLIVEALDVSPGAYKRLATLLCGPDVFVAHVVISRDVDGHPADTEIRWFDSEDAAREAISDTGGEK